MESNHPFAKINTTRDPKEIISDTIEINWGYIHFYLVISRTMLSILKLAEVSTPMFSMVLIKKLARGSPLKS